MNLRGLILNKEGINKAPIADLIKCVLANGGRIDGNKVHAESGQIIYTLTNAEVCALAG